MYKTPVIPWSGFAPACNYANASIAQQISPLYKVDAFRLRYRHGEKKICPPIAQRSSILPFASCNVASSACSSFARNRSCPMRGEKL